DVRALADRRITKIRQMHRLRAAFQSRLLDLDKVADGRFLLEQRVHTQVRKRSDSTVRLDLRIDDDRVILDHDRVTETRICDANSGANHTTFADYSLTLNR